MTKIYKEETILRTKILRMIMGEKKRTNGITVKIMVTMHLKARPRKGRKIVIRLILFRISSFTATINT